MIGIYLKKAREQANISLEDIAVRTRIRFEYLRALEEEGFDRLPAEIYTKGYIQAYLKAISQDPREGLRIYNEQLHGAIIKVSSVHDTEKKGFLPIKHLLYAVILLFIVAGAFFLIYQRQNVKSFHVKPTFSKPAILSQNNNSYALNNIKPVSPYEGGQRVITEDVTRTALKTTIVKEAESSVVAPQKDKHNLSLEVLEATWISITIDDKDKQAMMLKPGDTPQWSGNDNFSLRLGNAGGVRVSFDGKDQGIPGKRGSVLTVNYHQ
ncbi:MAG: helix-turn-helix domain-containing protein [Nitrospirae bacterium]|nr:helix-turn-helix domain-containing protein [Nitrospirota bacterium]